MFPLHVTKNNATQYDPAQLLLGRDSILNTRQEGNWQLKKKRKQDLINKRKQEKNRNQKEHTYNKRDKVLLKKYRVNNAEPKYIPYTITAVRNNCTVRARKSEETGIFNICKITPYKEYMLFYYDILHECTQL